MPRKLKRPNQQPNQLRIISGRFRGRKIDFMDGPGLRPTPDRVRETLFNWLASEVVGASCLDCFAGSGGLGFEALSRGAQNCFFVDNNPTVINQLDKTQSDFGLDDTEFGSSCTDGLKFLKKAIAPADIIFLDAPFNQGYLDHCIDAILANPVFNQTKWVYIEIEKYLNLNSILPSHWEIYREKTAGLVAFYLIKIGDK